MPEEEILGKDVSENQQPETYKQWLRQIKDLKGGGLGGLTVMLTVPFTFYAAYQAIVFFPSGTYPTVVLAIPGLLIAVVFFFAITALLWPLKRKS